jgi:hypothetical protein
MNSARAPWTFRVIRENLAKVLDIAAAQRYDWTRQRELPVAFGNSIASPTAPSSDQSDLYVGLRNSSILWSRLPTRGMACIATGITGAYPPRPRFAAR